MKSLEIMMRGLTHLNIGATIAFAAWFAFSLVHTAQDRARLLELGALSSVAANVVKEPLSAFVVLGPCCGWAGYMEEIV